MKKHLITLLLILMMLTGLGIMLYPTVSDMVVQGRQAQAMEQYRQMLSRQQKTKADIIWEAACAYNQALLDHPTGYLLNEEQRDQYNAQMDLDGSGMMGVIQIPKIDVELPLYHGTDDEVLKTAVGHIAGSSLPTGGKGTHSVFSGHRGLPSARLFTGLDRLALGDRFVLKVLGRTLIYEVDQILVVLPDETEALRIDPELDICTLVTCTPYGVNTHRLLVRGRRVAAMTDVGPLRVVSDVQKVDQIMVAPVASLPLIAAMAAWLLAAVKKMRRRNEKERNGERA